MSEVQATQAVVDETKATAQPVAAVDNARETTDDLDTLLAEFDKTETKAPETPKPEQAGTAQTDDAKRRLEALEKEFHAQQFQREIAPVIESIKVEIPEGVLTDAEILDLLDAKAKRDPRLQKAWLDRSNNLNGWKKVQDGLAREFGQRFKKLPDRQATEDRDAVTAAVRGASTKAPEGKAPDYARMTDAEFAAEKEKLGM